MAVTLPTYETGDWNHIASQEVPLLMQAEKELTKINMSTLEILWAKKQYYDLNVDGTFKLNLRYGGINPRYVGTHEVYNTEGTPNTTRIEFTPARMSNSAAFSKVELLNEFAEGTMLVDEMIRRQEAINVGLTFGIGYEVWGKQGYTIAGGIGAEANLPSIIIDNLWTNVQSEITIEDVPVVTGRFMSIPAVIQSNAAAHTYGGFSTANTMWSPHVYVNGVAGTITEMTATSGHAAWIADANASFPGMVTVQVTPIVWSAENIDLWLDEMQIGGGYNFLIATPPNIYSSIGRFLRGNDFGSAENPIVDLGVNHAFRHPAYNVTFYSDPTLAITHPNTLWAYDPEHLHMACCKNTCPLIEGWHQITGSTEVVFAKSLRYQLLTTNMRSCGALHGVSAS